MIAQVSPPTCRGVRKKDGQPCCSTALDANGFCSAHGRSPEKVSENARKAARRSGEARRERARSFRERLAQELNDRAEELVDSLLEAGKDDWRAITAGLDQAFGKPAQTIAGDVDQPLTIVVRSAFSESEQEDE